MRYVLIGMLLALGACGEDSGNNSSESTNGTGENVTVPAPVETNTGDTESSRQNWQNANDRGLERVKKLRQ